MLTDFSKYIGKKIWRTHSMCDCEICMDVFEDGLFILDDSHAAYIKDVSEETGLVYFETKEERDLWMYQSSNLSVTKP